jgi:16S rRNA (cytosine967-C5)-methyltransferase
MNYTAPQFDALVHALTIVLPLRSPADATLKQFFRDNRNLGGRDRALIADTTYAVLRRRRTLEAITPMATPRELALAALVKIAGVGINHIQHLVTQEEFDWLVELKKLNFESLPFEVRSDLPDWVLSRLRAQYPEKDLLSLTRALQQSAPLDLRVNTMRARRDEVLERFKAEGVAAGPTALSPLGIRMKEKIALNTHPLYLDGTVEVQDEGSQVLGLLLEPRRNDMVVDFCAGAGGKTLEIGALMNSQGRVYAFDVSEKRLANLGPRLKRSGLSNVHPQRITAENDTRVKRLRGKIDRVLVDAPCTGLGTLRRNPDLKWRQTEAGIAELNQKQAAILAAAAQLVKPGGRLVYGTCSFLAEENENIVAAFLAANPDFAIVPCGEVLARLKIAATACDEFLRLVPHVHDTDGFFAAVLERRK